MKIPMDNMPTKARTPSSPTRVHATGPAPPCRRRRRHSNAVETSATRGQRETHDDEHAGTVDLEQGRGARGLGDDGAPGVPVTEADVDR